MVFRPKDSPVERLIHRVNFYLNSDRPIFKLILKNFLDQNSICSWGLLHLLLYIWHSLPSCRGLLFCTNIFWCRHSHHLFLLHTEITKCFFHPLCEWSQFIFTQRTNMRFQPFEILGESVKSRSGLKQWLGVLPIVTNDLHEFWSFCNYICKLKRFTFSSSIMLCIWSSWCIGIFLMEWRNAIASATPMAILTRVSQGNAS